MKIYYRKSERKMSLCLPRFSQNVRLRALSSRLPNLLKTSYPSGKELGVNYKVRRAHMRPLALLTSAAGLDVACGEGQDVEGSPNSQVQKF